MQIIDCGREYSSAILAILNDAIVNSTALYDYKPRAPDAMVAWFDAKERGRFPVIGAISDAGELMGFASYGAFRPHPAYKYTIEHSLYVSANHRRKGVGRELLTQIIARAQQQDYHVMVGGIDSQNAGSIRLHGQFGFKLTGTLPQVGFKFGRWLDLCFYQLVLKTPGTPVDG